MSGKAANLQILHRNGIAVPMGFVIDDSHYLEAVTPYVEEILGLLPRSESVRELFERIELPPRTREMIKLNAEQIGHPSLYAVRSSGAVVAAGRAVVEDSSRVSLAGQFDSFLAVPEQEVELAVKLCWASLFNARSVAFFEADRAYVEDSRMTVVVQEMVPAIASAVIMTVDPLGPGHSGAMELALGPCEAIVAGLASPDSVVFSRESGQITEIVVGPKERMVVYDAFDRHSRNNGRLVSVEDADRTQLSVPPPLLVSIVYLAHRIESIFGSPQDIELVVRPDGALVVTQSRAITTLPPQSAAFHLLAA